jgi:small subunit ribosomal protein S17
LLQHVDPAVLHGRERDAALKAEKHKEIVGVVVRTGKMDKTVSVRVAGRRYEPRIGKV